MSKRPEDDATPAPGAPEVLSLAERQARRARIAELEALDEDDLPEDTVDMSRARGRARDRGGVAARLARVDEHLAQRPARTAAAAASPPEAPAFPIPENDGIRVRPTVRVARPRRRHWLVMASFVLCVLLPMVVTAWYLWTRAADRYGSYVGFSVRREETGSAVELLGGVAQMSGSSSSATDIRYYFIQSADLVRRVDQQLDLRAIWSRADPGVDPVFAYHPPGTIEDLTEYWSRMVKVYNDSGTGLIDLTVQAFTPQDAQAIAQIIFDESSNMINNLSAIAREDATRYARDELDQAVERLKAAREALTLFRNRNQIVDPNASIQSQMGLLSQLQVQLAETLIELDMLRLITSESDQRVAQALRRVEVIETRIADERQKLGMGSASDLNGGAFADLVGEYERLSVDLKFAEEAYTAALAAYDGAVAEARRKSRYIAAHIPPTLAERSDFPDRPMLLGLVGLFLFLIWGLAVLSVYAVKDRR